MLDFAKQNKILTLGVIVLVCALLYYIMYLSSDTSSPTLTSTADTQTSAVSQKLLVTLNNLHTIRLDESLFQMSAYISLTDFGVTIPPEAAGRRNPFAPVGGSLAPTPVQTPTSGR